MKHVSILISLFCIPFLIIANQFQYEKIHLDSISKEDFNIDSQVDKYSAVILKDHVITEYVFEDGKLFKYETEFRKIFINSEAGIDFFSRVYIYTANTLDLVDIEVLTTTKSGKTISLNIKNIKEVENLDNQGAYKIFAIEGIETGSIVQILHTQKKMFSDYGRYTFHDNFPTYKAIFELHTPSHLAFLTKAYNADFEKSDTTINNLKSVIYTADSLKSHREEVFSTWQANIPRIQYQFSNNTTTTFTEVNLWANAVQSFYPFFYNESKQDKKIKKILKSLNIKSMSETDKIKTIENYIKNSYEIKQERGIKDITELDFILEKNYSNKDGITKLFTKMLDIAGVEHQLGFTCDRFLSKFDKNFFSWHSIYEYVLYFPNIDTYLSPTTQEYRLGIIPVEIQNNDALFINAVTIGDITTVLPEIKFIPPAPMEKSYTIQTAKVSFDEDKTKALVQYKHELGGYESNYIKPYYDFIPDNKKDEIIDGMLKLMGEDTKIIEKHVYNTSHNISGLEESFIIEGKLEIESLVENAGENFIFNLGDVISEQVEMYDEHERDNDIELKHVHFYKRNIEIEIPQGYSAKGLDAIKIKKEYGNDEEKTMGFISDYTLNNNILSVVIYEYYKSIHYPVELYPQYRTVINAAADFNKISIVFEKL